MVAHVPWARPGAKHTWLFEDTCAWLAAHTALSVLTVLLRIAWRTVAAIVTRVVADGRDTNDLLDGLSRIGIDEIAYRKGHRYLTVIVDHTTGRLVWAGEGRNQDTLGRFFDELGAGRATRLTHVSCDGAEWIRAAMKTGGMKQLSIYPEDRGCAAPTAARILEIFTGLARHHLTDRHGNHVQTFTPTSPSYKRWSSTCSTSRTASTQLDTTIPWGSQKANQKCGKRVSYRLLRRVGVVLFRGLGALARRGWRTPFRLGSPTCGSARRSSCARYSAEPDCLGRTVP